MPLSRRQMLILLVTSVTLCLFVPGSLHAQDPAGYVTGTAYAADGTTATAANTTLRVYDFESKLLLGSLVTGAASTYKISLTSVPKEGTLCAVYSDTSTLGSIAAATVFFWTNGEQKTPESFVDLRGNSVRFDANDLADEFNYVNTGWNNLADIGSFISTANATTLTLVFGVGVEVFNGAKMTMPSGASLTSKSGFIVGSGAKFSAAGTGTITVQGKSKWTNDGTFGAGNSTLVMDGLLTAAGASTSTFYAFQVAAAKSFNVPAGITVQVTNSVSISGTLTVSGGTFSDLSGGTMTVNSGGTVNATSGTLAVGTPASHSTADLVIASGGKMTIAGASVAVCDELEAQSGAALTVSSGSLTVPAYTGTLTGTNDAKFDIEAGATFTASGGTVYINGGYLTTPALRFSGTVSGSSTAFVVQNGQATNENIYLDLKGKEVASLTLTKAGLTVYASTAVATAGAFTISAGTFNSNGQSVTVKGDWTNNGTYTASTSTVTFAGANQNLSFAGSGAFNNLTFSGSGTKTIKHDISASVVTVSAGITASLDTGIDLTLTGSGKTSSLLGTLYVPAGSWLTMAEKIVLSVGSGGKLKLSGKERDDATLAANCGPNGSMTEGYTITVADGGALDARNTRFSGGAITVSPGAAARVLLSEVAFFDAAKKDGAYLDISAVNESVLTLTMLSFEAGDTQLLKGMRNIKADADTQLAYVAGYTGDLGGETFDDDEANRVRWINNATPLEVDNGTAVSYAYSIEAAVESAGAGTLTISGRYLDDSGITVISPMMFSGTLNLPAFAGTVIFDGVTFASNAASSTLIAGAGGTVRFYNCMLLDPYDSQNDPAAQGRASVITGLTAHATLCTIDFDTAGSFASVTGSLTRAVAAGFGASSSSWFVSYAERNLRLTKTGGAALAGGATADASYPWDIDGHDRPAGANATCTGAHHYFSDAATVAQVNDITDDDGDGKGLASSGSAIVFSGAPRSNSLGSAYYLAGSDGASCYLAALSRTSAKVIAGHILSWKGAAAAYVTFLECSDSTPAKRQFWLYVPYDADGDGDYDHIRKVLHIKDVGFTDGGDVGDTKSQLANADGSVEDITESTGWNGSLFISTSFVTGADEPQVALTNQDDGGQVHVFYLNWVSTDGGFYADPAFDPSGANMAAESYVSGDYKLSPNAHAVVEIFGSGVGGSGSLVVTRDASAPSTEALVKLDRNKGLNEIDAVVNFWQMDGPADGERTFSKDPVLTVAAGGTRFAAFTRETKALALNPVLMTGVEFDAKLDGFGAPKGFAPAGASQTACSFFGYYNKSTGKGAVVAAEYYYAQDGADGGAKNIDTTWDILGKKYTGMDGKCSYHVGAPGFEDGIAYILGSPKAMRYSIADKALFCATDAGLLYCWRATGMTGENTDPRGALASGYPVRVPGGRITEVLIMPLTDAATLTSLGLAGASARVLCVCTDSGQLLLVRMPAF